MIQILNLRKNDSSIFPDIKWSMARNFWNANLSQEMRTNHRDRLDFRAKLTSSSFHNCLYEADAFAFSYTETIGFGIQVIDFNMFKPVHLFLSRNLFNVHACCKSLKLFISIFNETQRIASVDYANILDLVKWSEKELSNLSIFATSVRFTFKQQL